jgi:hypothetical protein
VPGRTAERDIADEAPLSKNLTPYDEAHHGTYVRLLDAAVDGASPQEMARIVLGIDPTREPKRAGWAVASHLARAVWMMKTGRQELFDS